MSDHTNLPINFLRTFVAIVDQGGFTQAAQALGLTQPTVSQQLKKLESLVAVELIDRSQRRITMTIAGQTMLDFARRILALNEEAISSLHETPVAGRLRLGIPHEFTTSVLPKLVGAFSTIHPHVVIEVECELSKELLARQDRYDVILALHRIDDDSAAAGGYRMREEALVWVANRGFRLNTRQKLPIIAAPRPCIYRDTLQRVLRNYDPGWALRLKSTSYGAVCAAVATGMGVTVLAKSVVPPDLTILSEPLLPELPAVDFRLHYERHRSNRATRTFVKFVRGQLI